MIAFAVRLLRSIDEVGALMAERPLTQRLHVVGYGQNHADLAPFLRAYSRPKVKAPAAGSR